MAPGQAVGSRSGVTRWLVIFVGLLVLTSCDGGMDPAAPTVTIPGVAQLNRPGRPIECTEVVRNIGFLLSLDDRSDIPDCRRQGEMHYYVWSADPDMYVRHTPAGPETTCVPDNFEIASPDELAQQSRGQKSEGVLRVTDLGVDSRTADLVYFNIQVDAGWITWREERPNGDSFCIKLMSLAPTTAMELISDYVRLEELG